MLLAVHTRKQEGTDTFCWSNAGRFRVILRCIAYFNACFFGGGVLGVVVFFSVGHHADCSFTLCFQIERSRLGSLQRHRSTSRFWALFFLISWALKEDAKCSDVPAVFGLVTFHSILMQFPPRLAPSVSTSAGGELKTTRLACSCVRHNSSFLDNNPLLSPCTVWCMRVWTSWDWIPARTPF